MCGRFALSQTPATVRAWFDYPDQPNFPPRYNIAPTQPIAVVVRQEGMPRFTLMRWGFIPGFVKDPKDFPLVINIRAETAAEKPSFRGALRHRRGLIPADGFYEWQRLGEVRQPYLIRRPDRGVFAFAALWETWSGADGSEIDTAAILTTHANGTLAGIHERMPIVLDRAASSAWLRPELNPGEIATFLKPAEDEFLEFLRIGTAVNRVANDDETVQRPLDGAAASKTPVAPAAKPRRDEPKDDPQGRLF